MLHVPLLLFSLLAAARAEAYTSSSAMPSSLHRIEGKVFPPEPKPRDWHSATRIVLDGGRKVGFLREDNTFVIQGLPSGSYLLEVINADHAYEAARVDITSKGKIRARKVNNVQPSQVSQVSYPLKMKPLGRHRYFHKREEWRATDLLTNPMVLMMILPLLLMSVLPKMMNDPEAKREMEQMQQSMNVQNQLPEVSEVMANWFGGGGGRNAAATSEKRKKKALRR